MDSARSVYSKFLKAIPKTYAELRDFFEKERPDWLQTLMPRRVNAPSVYWPQKVLAVATVHAAMHNQVASDVGRKSDPGFSAVEGQGAHLLNFEVPTYYVSEELIAAAARTECQLTFFWMRFHSRFRHWFSCSRKAQSDMLSTANVLT